MNLDPKPTSTWDRPDKWRRPGVTINTEPVARCGWVVWAFFAAMVLALAAIAWEVLT